MKDEFTIDAMQGTPAYITLSGDPHGKPDRMTNDLRL